CCVPSGMEGRNLSFFSAPDIASVAVSLGWDCKGRNLFRDRKIFFQIFFEALFSVVGRSCCALRCWPFSYLYVSDPAAVPPLRSGAKIGTKYLHFQGGGQSIFRRAA